MFIFASLVLMVSYPLFVFGVGGPYRGLLGAQALRSFRDDVEDIRPQLMEHLRLTELKKRQLTKLQEKLERLERLERLAQELGRSPINPSDSSSVCCRTGGRFEIQNFLTCQESRGVAVAPILCTNVRPTLIRLLTQIKNSFPPLYLLPGDGGMR